MGGGVEALRNPVHDVTADTIGQKFRNGVFLALDGEIIRIPLQTYKFFRIVIIRLSHSHHQVRAHPKGAHVSVLPLYVSNGLIRFQDQSQM